MRFCTTRLNVCNQWYLKNNIIQQIFYSKRSSAYSHTVNIPKTEFPLSLNSVHDRELQIQKKCNFEGLYEWQQKSGRCRKFVMHDGPPYANGKVHVGHALNKILKDIINRYKLLRGNEVVYNPGWDCHGTPIEQKALECVGRQVDEMGALEIRKMASKFAKESSMGQKSSFISWGVIADWKGGCYYTYNPQYEAKQLEAFYRLYDKGLVFQQYMPIFWSPSSKTALAESEIEYVGDYESTQVYLRLAIKHLSINHDSNPGKTYAVLWTTTPWTLPFNKAICYGEGVRYVLAQAPNGDNYVTSERFKSELERILNCPLSISCAFEGNQLESSVYISTNGDSAPFLPGSHVTSDKGTGLVHTAPAHGVEDFQVALKHRLPLECMVDDEGRYMKGVEGLEGKLVLREGNELVIQKLGDLVLHQSAFRHTYPHDWRTKEPIIVRASKQWFIDTNKMKEDAISGMKSVQSFPTSSLSSMQSQLNKRDYWCISRQRYWGVPLPVFYRQSDGKPLITRASIDHLKRLFLKHGSDCWWSMHVDQLLPQHVLHESGLNSEERYEKGSDILDIWFDSGVSWFCVLDGGDADGSGERDTSVCEMARNGSVGNGDSTRNRSVNGRDVKENYGEQVSDVCVEGLDQYGGWFMSSLLTSTALQARPPFKNLVVHGFALDEHGRKMSKSLGNVVDPDVVVKGDESNPGYGVDVLRMWVGGSGLDPSVVIGASVLQDAKQKLFRLRKSMRYLIGCLHDYQPANQPPNQPINQPINPSINHLHLTDQYMLHLLADLVTKVTESYEVFNISRVVRLVDHFNSNKLSAFYLHLVKDRLYCGDQSSRSSIQHTMHHLLHSLCKLLAPITPHLSEEVFQYHPMNQLSSSVFKTSDWLDANWENQSLANTYESLQPIRHGLFQLISSDRPSDFDVEICASDELMRGLKLLHHTTPSFTSPLCELLGTADISLLHSTSSSSFSSSSSSSLITKDFGDFELRLRASDMHKCGRCRRRTSKKMDSLCVRCAEVVKEGQMERMEE